MRDGAASVTVLGDVVASRAVPDPELRHAALRRALASANRSVGARQALTPTIGDEFQGLYDDLVSALDATLIVRLTLLGELDVRFGIGSGEVRSYDPGRAPFEQDGPAWWSAREAVDTVRATSQRREQPRGLRTRWVDASGAEPQLVGAVNAFLRCRDELISAMDPRDAATMLGLLADQPLAQIATSQDVSVSAVSQRAVRGGLYAIRRAHEELREATT